MKAIEIYTQPACPFCRHAKTLLQARDLPYWEIDTQDPLALQAMVRRTRGRTFPQIVINNRPVGGYSELKQLDESGELQLLLAAS